jgi:hypothetical protein
MPRTYSPQWLTRKTGTAKQRGKRFIVKPRKKVKTVVVKPHLKTESKYKVLVANLVREYKEKAALTKDIAITYDKTGQKLCDAKFVYGSPVHWIRINDKHLEELYQIDAEKAKRFLEYGVAHEIAHLQQYEQYGHEQMSRMPKFLMELDAEKRMTKLSGITTKEVDELTTFFERKFREKAGIKPKPPPSLDAPRLVINGKKAARVMGWESVKGGVVVPTRNVTEQNKNRVLPKNVKSVWIVEFAEDGTPIPRSDKFLKREELSEYWLVP